MHFYFESPKPSDFARSVNGFEPADRHESAPVAQQENDAVGRFAVAMPFILIALFAIVRGEDADTYYHGAWPLDS